MTVRGIILAGVVGCAIAGCDRVPEPAPPPSAPASQTSHTPASTTKPVEANAQFVIRQPDVPDLLIEFPPARLVLQVKDEQTRVTLFSKDPPAAQLGDYQGNSFWFETTFDVPTINELPGMELWWKNSYNERLDTNTGLFLRTQHVQPLEAMLRIERDGETWIAYVQGKFQVFTDGIDDKPATVVHVSAQLVPEVIVKP